MIEMNDVSMADLQKMENVAVVTSTTGQGDVPTNGESLRSAIKALLNNEDPISEQLPSMGCNIKWRVGEEPDYFLKVKG